MHAYSESYVDDVVENQGRLFDYFAQTYPNKSTEDFIVTYMKSKTRKSIDDSEKDSFRGSGAKRIYE